MKKLRNIVIVFAVVIILLGGLQIYASVSVNSTLRQAAQGIVISFEGPISKLELPNRWVYRITFGVDNPTSNAAQVVLTDTKVMVDRFPMALIPQGSWQGMIDPGGSVQFQGDITILENTLTQLQAKTEVMLEVQETVVVRADYLWVEKTARKAYIGTMAIGFD